MIKYELEMEPFLILGVNSRLAKVFRTIYPHNIFLSKTECDITSQKNLDSTFNKYTFKYVLNCAAITDISLCETSPKLCYDVNSIAVSNIQKVCHKYNRKLIHISSDYAVNPVNIYGFSKYISESILDDYSLIVRTNFYDTQTYIINKILNKEIVQSYENVYFNPVSIIRLVHEIYRNKDKNGLLNIFSDKKISMYTFAKKVTTIFGEDAALVKTSKYRQVVNAPAHPLSSYVKPDITVDIETDLEDFKKYLSNENR